MTCSGFCLTVAALIGGSIGLAGSARACSCGGVLSSAENFRAADSVFVGVVTHVDEPKFRSEVNADGSAHGGPENKPTVTTFEVIHVYRGRAARQMEITGGANTCGVRFRPGETWLVYAHESDGHLAAGMCTRTRLRAEASQDLKYLDGRERGDAQGILFGEVLRRIAEADGRPANQALFEPLAVIASGTGGRFQVTTDRWGPYQLVLPPGDYTVWAERGGRRVTTPQSIHIENGKETRLMVIADYRD